MKEEHESNGRQGTTYMRPADEKDSQHWGDVMYNTMPLQ
jgi:hypothetical protein